MSHPFKPLTGVHVVDFSKVLAGPLCTQYLSDLGADVIKVEARGTGDDTRQWPPFEGKDGVVFLSVNRGKRSIAVDLKTGPGREICKRLAARADVAIESFGPGVATRLGIDYAALQAVNPRLIYASISGYGTVGPMRDGKGYDVILQAFTGMIAMSGEENGPPVRSPFSPVDQATGLHTVIGVLGAIVERARTGSGMKVDTSLFDSSVSFLGYFLQAYWKRGTEPKRVGSGHESLCPYQVFDTRDLPLILGVANDTLWRSFCQVAQAPELAQDPRFATNVTRVDHRAETVAVVAKLMLGKSRGEWLQALGQAGIPCSPVHTLGELSAHPHTEASGMVVQYVGADGRTLKGVAQPLRIDGERLAKTERPPMLGEHTSAVLQELGYDEAQIAALMADRIVSAAAD